MNSNFYRHFNIFYNHFIKVILFAKTLSLLFKTDKNEY